MHGQIPEESFVTSLWPDGYGYWHFLAQNTFTTRLEDAVDTAQSYSVLSQ